MATSHTDVNPSVAAPPPAVARPKDDDDDDTQPTSKSCTSNACTCITSCPANTGKCISTCQSNAATAAFNCYGHCLPVCAGDEVMKRQGNLIPPSTWTKRRWANEQLVPCDDLNVSLYVCFCPCCAAGDVADAAGPPRERHMSCFFIPLIMPCLWPCWLATDRLLLAKRYAINDDQVGFYSACAMGYCGCAQLLLCQELNTVRAIQADAAERHRIRDAEEAAAQARRDAALRLERQAKEEAKAARIAAMALPPPQQAMGEAAAAPPPPPAAGVGAA